MRATATAQPNIALIKYWGKRDAGRNLPAAGSISITLADLGTTMAVELDAALCDDELSVDGEANGALLPRVSRCLDSVAGSDRHRARVESASNFPMAAGLASSASAFAALVVATSAAVESDRSVAELASLAGQASGSAARSLYGGFAELRNTDGGIVVEQLRAPHDWPLRVVVAITEPGPKPVGSSEAMDISRRTSPFYRRWIEQQDDDLDEARAAIATRDFGKLAAIAEHNCLKMHSVMWASRPPLNYWNGTTVECMQAIRGLQADGVAVFFTIDAGPQLKAVCEPGEMERVREVLAATPGVRQVMVSELGEGAKCVADE